MTATQEKEKAPAAGTAEATSPQKGTEMNNTMVRADRIEVEPLLKELEQIGDGQYVALDPNHPAYMPPLDVWVRPASEFSDPDAVRQAIGTWNNSHRFVQVFEIATGNRVQFDELPEEYFDEVREKHPLPKTWHLLNAVSRLGDDHLIVGVGDWELVGERVLDGEPAFEFISTQESHRRDEVARQKALVKVLPVAPSWADPYNVAIIDVDPAQNLVEVSFESREFLPADCQWGATLRITQYARLTLDGSVLKMESPRAFVDIPEIWFEGEVITGNDLRAIADGLWSLAAEFDRITAAEATA